MAQRDAFRREHEVGENFALGFHAVVKFHLRRVLHGLYALGRCREIFRHRGDGVKCEFEVPVRLGMPDAQVAYERQRTHVGNRKRVGNRARHEIAIDHFVEQFLSGETRDEFAFDRFAGDDHVERSFNTNHARQTLRAAGAGDQTELDLRQRDAGTGGGHTVVATQS